MQRLRTKVYFLAKSRPHAITYSYSTAIDRVHRIGQEKTVHVKHFIVKISHSAYLQDPTLIFIQIKNTIEGNILDIQQRKTAIVKEAFRGTNKSGEADPESLANLKLIFGEK